MLIVCYRKWKWKWRIFVDNRRPASYREFRSNTNPVLWRRILRSLVNVVTFRSLSVTLVSFYLWPAGSIWVERTRAISSLSFLGLGVVVEYPPRTPAISFVLDSHEPVVKGQVVPNRVLWAEMKIGITYTAGIKCRPQNADWKISKMYIIYVLKIELMFQFKFYYFNTCITSSTLVRIAWCLLGRLALNKSFVVLSFCWLYIIKSLYIITNVTCSLSEMVDIYKHITEECRKNVHRVIIDRGPYKLDDSQAHIKVLYQQRLRGTWVMRRKNRI